VEFTRNILEVLSVLILTFVDIKTLKGIIDRQMVESGYEFMTYAETADDIYQV
jgi:hypothetical protein